METKKILYNKFFLILIAVLVLGCGTKSVFAQYGESALFVPLVGISSVPDALALPNGSGNVTYKYAVKNFLREDTLTDVQVTDDKCSPVKFVEGDDNNDGKLDYSETWRYTCTTKLSVTTDSIAMVTAISTANNLPAAHKSYVTVVVGSANPAPLVNIVNVTKVNYPLSLPIERDNITFTYRVNNPGVVPLSNVSVVDDKCSAMSGKLGDTNGNNLLDINEVWVYTCTTTLNQTTTNTTTVTAFANGREAFDNTTLTATVAVPTVGSSPSLPAQTISSMPGTGVNPNLKIALWAVLLIVLVSIIFFVLKRGKIINKKIIFKLILTIIIVGGIAGALYYFVFSKPDNAGNTVADNAFGWKFPIVKFPITGPSDIAYSDIRDPGGIPEGLPVRLKIPVIGVDSAIEDALITPDGRMDVPQGSVNVAWFALGPHPGKVGSAVIGGHFGIRDRKKFVFYDLDKVKVGDKVYIIDDKDETLTFIVREIKLFDRDADATTVFTSSDGLAHLNLITCEGIWNQVNGSYPKRRVVFTDAIPTEVVVAPTITPAPAVSTFSHTLSIGARGSDVVALQNALEQKGFFRIRPGVSKGYFGTTTRDALAKYQKSAGLPADGVFGPLTRAKLALDLALDLEVAKAKPPVVVDSKLPATGIIVPVSSLSFPQLIIQSVKNSFATPLYGLITCLLLVMIIFVVFKIIKK